MANTTVYPYGTGGTLPASIGLINDLTTGGVDKALTAEMGKLLGQMIKSGIQSAAVSQDGIYFVDAFLNIVASIDSDGVHAVNILTFEEVE